MSKPYYVRLKSLSNLACETQEIKASDWHRACEAGRIAAENWSRGNGSEAVRWRVEDFSGSLIGEGEWTVTPQADPDAERNVTLAVSLNEAWIILAALSRRHDELCLAVSAPGCDEDRAAAASLLAKVKATHQSIDQQTFGRSLVSHGPKCPASV